MENWSHTKLGKTWDIYSESGEERGVEYPTGVGKIDILAQKKKGKDFLVVELKRDQTGDATVGQVMRYMTWVRRHMAKGVKVSGMIIVRETDDKLMYALDGLPNIRLMRYEVRFELADVPLVFNAK